jgi:Na+/proline symporter
MHLLDWIVLFLTLGLIAAYGIYKTKKSSSLNEYLNSGNNTPWWAIGLSIMATQASAITFLSTPGLGYESGLRFVQFYFGMPIALIIVAYGFAPLFHKQKVYTAYEYLENKFDVKIRSLAAFLFLVQRGLAAGITIYAPSIVLSAILGWPLYFNILLIGLIVIAYTMVGGNTAVTQTHKQQMAVIFIGLFIAFGYLVWYIQPYASFNQILKISSITGRLTSIDTTFNLNERYNIWSGLIGGTFLMLSYFGTDQSQVQRYLSGKSLKEIRTGLLFNAVFKIPMQYFILFLGVLLFVFYQFYQPPSYFDQQASVSITDNNTRNEIEKEHQQLFNQKKENLTQYLKTNSALHLEKYKNDLVQEKERNQNLTKTIVDSGYQTKVKQNDFIFISFILKYLPAGLIGLLLAVIFSAAMSSTSAELSALSTTSGIDLYKRLISPNASEAEQLKFAKLSTLAWGVLAILFALVAGMFENLVEAVNILGSLFYGTILGIFLSSLFLPKSFANRIFIAAIIAQVIVFALFVFKSQLTQSLGFEVSFLWYNVIASFIICAIGATGFLFKNGKTLQ